MASHFKRCQRNNAQIPSSADQISVAAEIIRSNADLVVEILQRLPAKSLLRFRSVSKEWLFLISSRRFSLLHWLQQQHQQFHDPKISGLFLTSELTDKSPFKFTKYIPLINGGDENKSLALNMNTSTTTIEHSCNGFLLLCCLTKQSNNLIDTSYHVCNPTTKRLSSLPWPFFFTQLYPPDYLYLFFDPSKSLHYKVVFFQNSLLESGYGYSCQVHIYSSETHAWRGPQPNIGDHHYPFKAPLSVEFEHGVYCNGSVHWISFGGRPSIYFDVDQERYCTMPSPPFELGTFYSFHFGESRGHLHLIPSTGYNLDIFEMESDYSKWSLKRRVSLDLLLVDLASREEMVISFDTVRVLSLIHGEDEEDVFLVLFVDTTMIISYNIKDNTFKKLDDVASHHVSSSHDFSLFKRPHHVHPYIETLFPV
ncbi:F-box protein At5g07610-like [Cornus florida]|uniref:F-box protein At5g07610-like n=1 Tax=Cornus florida TaxID=4283 RepID=UPI0028967D04|nr:F-box protein At5g07610-like [Cornus florida]